MIRAVVVAVVVFLLTACTLPGTGEPEEVWLPKCRTVWVPGGSLPADYIGCQMGAVGWSWPQFVTVCESGPDLYVFGEEEWGLPGGPVHDVTDAADDPAYRAAWRRCRGLD